MKKRLSSNEFPRITSIFVISVSKLTKKSRSCKFPRWVTIPPLTRLVYYPDPDTEPDHDPHPHPDLELDPDPEPTPEPASDPDIDSDPDLDLDPNPASASDRST